VTTSDLPGKFQAQFRNMVSMPGLHYKNQDDEHQPEAQYKKYQGLNDNH
jgi:hypothetical protein